MFTFAGHAEKSFYTWGDILGKEFIADYQKTTIAKATADIWFDGKHFHRKIKGAYVSISKDIFLNYLTVDCKLSSKPDKSGQSPVQQALSHIYNEQLVKGAAPAVPLPQGIHIFMGNRCLNTYNGRAILPAVGTQHWGPLGNFPFISALLEFFFDPVDQLDDYLAWGQYYYVGIKDQVSRPGPAMYVGGAPGCGKTLISRNIWGAAVGGYADAAQFVLKGSQFNSNLLAIPHWTIDDDTTSANDYVANQSHMMIKKIIANDSFEYHCKYEVPCMTPWGGRLHFTFNINEASGRVVGTLDGDMIAKVCLLKCADIANRKDGFKFPARGEILKLISTELPFFLRWLEDHTVPETVKRDPERYGYVSRHEDSLKEKAQASSPVGPFKEVMLETILTWFRDNPGSKEFATSISGLIKLIATTSVDNTILRSMKMEKVTSYLEHLANENFLNCKSTSKDNSQRVRIWTFSRPENL
jgi:hypothetical protein